MTNNLQQRVNKNGGIKPPVIYLTKGILLELVLLVVMGCSLTSQAKQAATPESQSDGWTEIAPGLTTRMIRVESPYTAVPFDMVVARVDPSLIQLKVHYEPATVRTLPDWKSSLSSPLMIVNASFFTAEGYAVGLVVTDGQFYGNSLQGYGGMLQISGEEALVRSLVVEPYQGEIYDHAAQGFPMFVQPGGSPARTGEGFDDPSRRTIVAQTTDGYILFMITGTGTLTLRNALNWLHENEHFEIDVAFGLDGGKSTGMYLATQGNGTTYPSIDPIPVVIAAYPR